MNYDGSNHLLMHCFFGLKTNILIFMHLRFKAHDLAHYLEKINPNFTNIQR